MLEIYKPVVFPGFKKNMLYAFSLLVAYPTIFLSPVWSMLFHFEASSILAKLSAVTVALLHLILSPLLVLYALALPFFGCRLYLHSPAAQTISDIEQQMRDSNQAN
jgi:Flp pilus assembly protein TadB